MPDKSSVDIKEFSKDSVKLIEEVYKRKRDLIISNKGVPIVKIAPYDEKVAPPFAFIKGMVEVKKDIVASPMRKKRRKV